MFLRFAVFARHKKKNIALSLNGILGDEWHRTLPKWLQTDGISLFKNGNIFISFPRWRSLYGLFSLIDGFRCRQFYQNVLRNNFSHGYSGWFQKHLTCIFIHSSFIRLCELQVSLTPIFSTSKFIELQYFRNFYRRAKYVSVIFTIYRGHTSVQEYFYHKRFLFLIFLYKNNDR